MKLFFLINQNKLLVRVFWLLIGAVLGFFFYHRSDDRWSVGIWSVGPICSPRGYLKENRYRKRLIVDDMTRNEPNKGNGNETEVGQEDKLLIIGNQSVDSPASFAKHFCLRDNSSTASYSTEKRLRFCGSRKSGATVSFLGGNLLDGLWRLAKLNSYGSSIAASTFQPTLYTERRTTTLSSAPNRLCKICAKSPHGASFMAGGIGISGNGNRESSTGGGMCRSARLTTLPLPGIRILTSSCSSSGATWWIRSSIHPANIAFPKDVRQAFLSNLHMDV